MLIFGRIFYSPSWLEMHGHRSDPLPGTVSQLAQAFKRMLHGASSLLHTDCHLQHRVKAVTWLVSGALVVLLMAWPWPTTSGNPFTRFHALPPSIHCLVTAGLQMQGNRYLFSKGADVLVGSTHDFEDKLRQTNTWYVGGSSASFFVIGACSQSLGMAVYNTPLHLAIMCVQVDRGHEHAL